jgi:hypothetical protein
MKRCCAAAVVALLIIGIPSHSLAQSSKLLSEIREARAFLSELYGMEEASMVEARIRQRVQAGDAVSKHRALLGEAMKARYNPYSDRFILQYYQGGKPQDPGGQGYWVLTIEVDAKHRIAKVAVGIAKH